MSKKPLSLLLALTLIFGVLPVSAFASESNTEIIIIDETPGTAGTTNGGGFLTSDEDDDPDALLECDCESKCTGDAINADCPVCAEHPEWCIVGVEAQAFAPVTAEDDADQLASDLGLGAAVNAYYPTQVNVTGNIAITNASPAIIVKSGVTLIISDGGSITISRTDITTGIEVQSGGFFTVAGGGLLTVVNTNGIGIDVQSGGSDIGVMELDSTGAVNVQNSAGTGIKVSGSMSVAASNSVVNVSNSNGIGISVDGEMLVAYNGAVNINNTVAGTTGIGVAAGGTMTVSNNGTVTVNTEAAPSTQNKGIEVSGGALNVSGGTVNVDNNGGVSTGIYLTSSGTMTVQSGTVNITSSSVSAGINISSSANMNINGGAVNVNNSTGAGIIVSGPL